jgi:hypothetical protein
MKGGGMGYLRPCADARFRSNRQGSGGTDGNGERLEHRQTRFRKSDGCVPHTPHLKAAGQTRWAIKPCKKIRRSARGFLPRRCNLFGGMAVSVEPDAMGLECPRPARRTALPIRAQSDPFRSAPPRSYARRADSSSGSARRPQADRYRDRSSRSCRRSS